MKALRIASENLETTSELCPWCGVDDGAHSLVHSGIGFFSTSKIVKLVVPSERLVSFRTLNLTARIAPQVFRSTVRGLRIVGYRGHRS